MAWRQPGVCDLLAPRGATTARRRRVARRLRVGEVVGEREFKQMIVDEFLGLVEDPRIDRTRKHSLETIVMLSLMAVIGDTSRKTGR